MKKNISMIRKVGGFGLAGVLVLGSTTAAAVDFTGSVTVQNNIEVVNNGELSFGTISVAASAGDGTAANAEYAAIELQPDGTVTSGSSDAASVEILDLGGATPALASVVTASDFTLQFPAGSWVAEADDIADLATDKDAAIPLISDGVVLTNTAGNPGIPDFYLINLTVGEVSQPAGFGEPTVAQGGSDLDTWDFTAGVDTQQFDFAIGGTLATDPDVAEAYQEVLYEGTFEVTASF